MLVMWERWVGDRTDCNILTPSSSDYSSTSSSFCWAAQPGSWGPKPSAGSWFSLRGQLRLELNCNSNSNWLELQWHPVIKLFDIHLLLVSVLFAPNSTRLRSRWYPDIFDRMHLLFNWRLGRGSICSTKGINTKMKRNYLVPDLHSGCRVYFLT